MTNDMHLHWGRLGTVVVGLVSLAVLAFLMLRGVDEQRMILEDGRPTGFPAAEAPAPRSPFTYEDGGLNFTLLLPDSWQGKRTFVTDIVGSKGGRIVAVSLPAEQYRDCVTDPQRLAQGVMVVGVQAWPKTEILAERARCEKEKQLIDRYQQAMEAGNEIKLTSAQSKLVDACLSAYDPESSFTLGTKEHYLGADELYYYYRMPLTAFDNGFKTVPDELRQEIDRAYQSFQTK